MTRDSDKPKLQARKGPDIQKAALEYLNAAELKPCLRCETSKVGRRYEPPELIRAQECWSPEHATAPVNRISSTGPSRDENSYFQDEDTRSYS